MDYQTLQDEIKSAMKAHDNNRRDILRQVHTELKAIEVNERRDITEADVDAMLKRVIKQTKETLDGSIKAGNNQERTDTLTEQVAILEGYLPEQVEGEALMALIDEVVAETGATTKKDMGRVVGALPAGLSSARARAEKAEEISRRAKSAAERAQKCSESARRLGELSRAATVEARMRLAKPPAKTGGGESLNPAPKKISPREMADLAARRSEELGEPYSKSFAAIRRQFAFHNPQTKGIK